MKSAILKSESTESVKRVLARASELGIVTKSGAPMNQSHLDELLAAQAGYSDVQSFKAALAEQEKPALEQENPHEANNDYKLVEGKGVWIRMGAFSVHPYLTHEGVIVDVYANTAESDPLATAGATVEDALEVLLVDAAVDEQDLAVWLQEKDACAFETLAPDARVTCVQDYIKVRAPLVKQIYCIALEGDAETGVQWFNQESVRDAAKGTLGAETEVYFEMTVLASLSADEVTELADRMAWDKTYVQASTDTVVGPLGLGLVL